MFTVSNRFFFVFSFIASAALFLFSNNLFADLPTALIKIDANSVAVYDILLAESAVEIESVLKSGKRFQPLIVNNEFSKPGTIEIYLRMIMIGNKHGCEVVVKSDDSDYSEFNFRFLITDQLLRIIPYIAAREIAVYNGKIPLITDLEIESDKSAIMRAGADSGIKTGRTYKTDSEIIIKTESVALGSSKVKIVSSNKLSGSDDIIKTVRINEYIKLDRVVQFYDKNIEKARVNAQSIEVRLHAGAESEKRFLESLFVINPAGNILIPGYGAFLSTYYLGFENPHPSYLNIAYTATAYGVHLGLVPALTGFKGNFFPWVRDSDKSQQMQRLHIYTWASIPFTFTASFMDNIAVECRRSAVLPPMAQYSNQMSLFLSAVFPGAGLFYKGNRPAGWLYYSSFTLLGGYSVWKFDTDKRPLIGLAALKTAELIHTYFADWGYDYNYGKVEFAFYPIIDKDNNTYVCSIGYRF